jgi:hypothetical protein
MRDGDSSTSRTDARAAEIAALKSALAECHVRIAERDARIIERDARIVVLERERDELRAAYERLWLDVELMRRRIFIAKAERVDTAQLELEFKDKLAALDKLAGTLGLFGAENAAGDKGGGSRPKPKGRRDPAPGQDARGARRAARPRDGGARRTGPGRAPGQLRGIEQDRVAARRPASPRRLADKVPYARRHRRVARDHLHRHRADAA